MKDNNTYVYIFGYLLIFKVNEYCIFFVKVEAIVVLTL